MANTKKYLRTLKKLDLGIYLPYVESVVFEVEGMTSRSEIEILKLRLKKFGQYLLFFCLLLSMIIMPSFLITIARQIPDITIYELIAYYVWIGVGLYASTIYFRSLKDKKMKIKVEIQSIKQAANIVSEYAQRTVEAYFDDTSKTIDTTGFNINKEQIKDIDSAMNRCEIDLTMFDRLAYNNDAYRELRVNDKRRNPKAKKLSLQFLTGYLNQCKKKYKQN